MENNDSSMTDRDRNMRESFESYNDDDANKKDNRKKRDTKTPSLRSVLFGSSNQVSLEAKDSQSKTATWLERRKNLSGNQDSLLQSILKEANAQRKSQEAIAENSGEKTHVEQPKLTKDKLEVNAAPPEQAAKSAAESILASLERNQDGEQILENSNEKVESTEVEDATGSLHEPNKSDEPSQSLHASAEAAVVATNETEQTEKPEQPQSKQIVAASRGRSGQTPDGLKQSDSSTDTTQLDSSAKDEHGPARTETGPNVFQPSDPNIIAVATANVDPGLAKMNEFYYRRKNTGTFVLAGVLGFAIGRQSGRINTEGSMQQREALNEQIGLQTAETSETNQGESATELPTTLHTAERSTAGHSRVGESQPAAPASKEIDARSMTMPELLQAAANIEVGGNSLKELYEQNRIDAVNLRKIVAEHAAGRNYEQLVTSALEAEEMKHELRSETRTSSSVVPGTTDSTKKTDDKFDQQKEDTSDTTAPETAPAEPPPMLLDRSAQVESQAHETSLPIEDGRTEYQQLQLLYAPQPRSSYTPALEPKLETEYVRVSLPVAIAIGVLTGGVCAGLLLILIF